MHMHGTLVCTDSKPGGVMHAYRTPYVSAAGCLLTCFTLFAGNDWHRLSLQDHVLGRQDSAVAVVVGVS
jgi:hypothetical protein